MFARHGELRPLSLRKAENFCKRFVDFRFGNGNPVNRQRNAVVFKITFYDVGIREIAEFEPDFSLIKRVVSEQGVTDVLLDLLRRFERV